MDKGLQCGSGGSLSALQDGNIRKQSSHLQGIQGIEPQPAQSHALSDFRRSYKNLLPSSQHFM